MTVFWCTTHGCGETRPADVNYICELRFHHPTDFPGVCVVVEAELVTS